jgi:hypothetical protein
MLTIQCTKCHGEGRVPLPAYLADTLALIPRRGVVNAIKLCRKMGSVGMTAMCNRLAELFALGLVERERQYHHGRGKTCWAYSRTPESHEK